MKKLLVITACLCINLSFIMAQQGEGGSITLPDLKDDVKALENAPVIVPGPDLLSLPLPSIAPPLPVEEEIRIPESLLTATGQMEVWSQESQKDTYGEAVVGAFLWDGVSAHLSLYRPASNPAFTIQFTHESQDGFAYHEAGSGFSYRETTLRGNFRGGTEGGVLWSLSAAFKDQSNGLQGQSMDFFSISHRYLSLSPNLRISLGDFTVYSELPMTSAALSLEGGQHPVLGDVRAQELGLMPVIGLEWGQDIWRVTLKGEYTFYGLINNPKAVSSPDRLTQQGQLTLASVLDVSPAFQGGTSLGIGTNNAIAWYVPFALWFDAGLSDYLSVSVTGGLESKTQSLQELWQENPYTDIGPVPQADVHWYALGTINLYPWNGMYLRLKTDWQSSYGGTGRVRIKDQSNADTRGLYSYETGPYKQLHTQLELRNSWQYADATLGWSAQWLDRETGRAYELYGSFEYRDRTDRFGTVGSAAISFDGTGVDIPRFDMQSYVQIGTDIRILGDIQDLFVAFRGTEGRSFWKPYLERGFQAGLRLQFSL